MWSMINNADDIAAFMNSVGYFHDSCIKEIKYVSGAFVNEDLAMHPINDKRNLSIIIQRQKAPMSVIELFFEKIDFLRLFPNDERYTCEILGAAMFIKDGNIYWCDCGDITEESIDEYGGTVVCASKLRWRAIEARLGKEEFFIPKSQP